MQSRLLLNIGLLALVVILGLVIFNLRDDSDEYRLSSLNPDDITAVEIAHRERYVVLKKTNGQWQMTRPIQIAANNFRVGSLLSLINTTTHASYDVDSLDLSKFKLDQPRTILRVSDGSNEIQFEFGASNPVNRLRYVRVGERMHLIDDHFYPLVASQLGTLVSLDLLPGIEQITALSLPEAKLLYRNNSWQVLPETLPLSADDINELIDNWQHAQAFGVHDYLQRKQLGKVEITATAEGTDSIIRFEITDTEPWLILARPELGIEYHIQAEHYDRLMRPGYRQDKSILDTEEAAMQQTGRL